MKKILLIATGGTIASQESRQGLAPAIPADELTKSVPALGTLADISCLQLLNLDSTNITPEHWLLMAQTIERHYDGYDGFVITHGTDTMAYTAAALSYLIQNSPKPIVLTGAQKPISLSDTDARSNLLDSFRYVCDDLSHDVSVVFDGKVILGTRAKKERSKSYNAFSSVDYPEEAVIRGGQIIRYLAVRTYAPGDRPTFFHRMEQNVLMMTLIPGMGAEALRLLRDRYQAVICQSFGVGGVPGGGDGPLAREMGEWIRLGKTVVIMTQVPYEGSDMEVYQVGKQVKEKYSVIEAHNMTMEAVTSKLMWALGNADTPAGVRALFAAPVRCDAV